MTADAPKAFTPDLGRRLIMEVLGTMALCFTIGVAAGGGQPLAPIAIGSTLMAAVYFGGHVSGAQVTATCVFEHAALLQCRLGSTDGHSFACSTTRPSLSL